MSSAWRDDSGLLSCRSGGSRRSSGYAEDRLLTGVSDGVLYTSVAFYSPARVARVDMRG
jgi:hypothetical protein